MARNRKRGSAGTYQAKAAGEFGPGRGADRFKTSHRSFSRPRVADSAPDPSTELGFMKEWLNPFRVVEKARELFN